MAVSHPKLLHVVGVMVLPLAAASAGSRRWWRHQRGSRGRLHALHRAHTNPSTSEPAPWSLVIAAREGNTAGTRYARGAGSSHTKWLLVAGLVALALCGLGSAALGVSSAMLATDNDRDVAVRAYNDAVHAWTATGREAFKAQHADTVIRLNGTDLLPTLRLDGTEPGGVVAGGGTVGRAQIPTDIADRRADVARYRLTHALWAGRGALVAKGATSAASVEVALTKRRFSGRAAADHAFFPLSTSFAPYRCTVSSYSLKMSDRVDCDACGSSQCNGKCANRRGNRVVLASHEWVRRVTVVQEAGPNPPPHLRAPSSDACALERVGIETRSETAATARAACESTRVSAPFDVDLEVVVRSAADPHVKAGDATACTYDFGPSGAEHVANAVFLLLLAGLCGGSAGYVTWRARGAGRGHGEADVAGERRGTERGALRERRPFSGGYIFGRGLLWTAPSPPTALDPGDDDARRAEGEGGRGGGSGEGVTVRVLRRVGSPVGSDDETVRDAVSPESAAAPRTVSSSPPVSPPTTSIAP